jgi:hypothetical protein
VKESGEPHPHRRSFSFIVVGGAPWTCGSARQRSNLATGEAPPTMSLAIGTWRCGRSLGQVNRACEVGAPTLVMNSTTGSRLGVQFAHISNAGLHKRNPGDNELLTKYALRHRSNCRLREHAQCC